MSSAPIEPQAAYRIPPVPMRPWFRFGMRQMLIAMTVVSLLFAAIYWQRSLRVYEISALLQITSVKPFNGGFFSEFKSEQAQLVTSNRVLQAVLSKRRVGRLPLVQAQDDPVAWLRKELRVDYPGDATILRISLRTRGYGKPQAGVIVNAVVEAYLEELKNTDPSTFERAKLVRPAPGS